MPLSEDALRKYQQAGRIAAEVRSQIRRIAHENMPIIELCEKTESLIRERGGRPAFPCNVSINEIAAHYTSSPGDRRTIPEDSIVKVDIGVHVDGYIADTATTVCFNPEHESMVQAAEEALGKAIEILHPGLPISRFGSIVEGTIKARGLKPVSNLTGHQVGRYQIHAGKSLPNVSHVSLSKINVDEVYAIEPFVTVADAVGRVENWAEAHIFRFQKRKSLKNPYAKQLLRYIHENFHTLPFTERWLQKCVPQNNYRDAFSELLSSRSVISYPVFIEVSRKPVAQAEHTVLIQERGCVVLT